MAIAKKTIKKETKVVVKKTRSTSSVQEPKVSKEPKELKANSAGSTLKISVVDTDGKASGTMMLPEAIFGAKVNPTLMAQAVRVYLANQRQGNASTKTRGEVSLTTAKWYRQKGTGRARHGAKSAPIFVKGGVAHGPHPRDYSLSMPTKMKRAALFSALTAQLKSGNVIVVAGLEKVAPKTKSMAGVLKKVEAGKKALVVMPSLLESVFKAGRNIKGVSLSPAQELSTYTVLDAKKIIFMKEAIDKISETFVKPVHIAQEK